MKTLTICSIFLFRILSCLHFVCFQVGCDAIKEPRTMAKKNQKACFSDNWQLLKCFVFYIRGTWRPRWAAQKVVKQGRRCQDSPRPQSLSVVQSRKHRKMVAKRWDFWSERVVVSWIIRRGNSICEAFLLLYVWPATSQQELSPNWSWRVFRRTYLLHSRRFLIHVDVCQSNNVAGGRVLF